MTYRFIAQVACGLDNEDEDDCMMAGVAESDDGDAFSLIFMCDFEEPDAQEVSLGFDTHCLVTPDQGTAYGCVREVTLNGDVLRVVLDPDSLASLGLDEPVIEVVLRAPPEDVGRMRDVLPRILAYGRPAARPFLVEL
ncbi:Imm10 family immunity protein [Streptomyces spiramyceticus]|uniref:Imm10 family immunity protein n=1 Tax=Streptomyces spiramyceticus TaxID=299717 RepID=UPI00237AF790|nr:Imm10 family immunity protein [Streptomyces spiramyceticus]